MQALALASLVPKGEDAGEEAGSSGHKPRKEDADDDEGGETFWRKRLETLGLVAHWDARPD